VQNVVETSHHTTSSDDKVGHHRDTGKWVPVSIYNYIRPVQFRNGLAETTAVAED